MLDLRRPGRTSQGGTEASDVDGSVLEGPSETLTIEELTVTRWLKVSCVTLGSS